MKCLSCGAENTASAKHCEYCGGDLNSQAKKVAPEKIDNNFHSNQAKAPESDLNSYIPNSDHPIFHVWNRDFPRNTFNWWAFFFPIAFLAGYGAKKAAVGASVQVVALALLTHIIFATVGYNLFEIGLTPIILLLIPICILAYKISIYSDYLVGARGDFNVGIAIVAQIIYTVIYNWAMR